MDLHLAIDHRRRNKEGSRDDKHIMDLEAQQLYHVLR